MTFERALTLARPRVPTRTVMSYEPDATRHPLGENTTLLTQPV